jgi:hypothetical protein
MKKIAPVFWFVVLLVAAFALSFSVRAGPVTAQTSSTLVDRAGGAYNGIEVTLSADAAPAPGGTVTLTLTARPLRDAPNVYIEWELPDGGTLPDGPSFEKLGQVAAGEVVTTTRHIRFDGTGTYQVSAKAYYFPNDATSLAAVGVLFFTTGPGAPVASDFDPRTPIYTPPAAKRTIDKSHLARATGRAADGCFSVSGLLSRENKMPFAEVVDEGTPAPAVPRYVGKYQDQKGSAVPIHHILVEMREEDTISDDSYGHTLTDANGKFTFNFCDDDGFLDDELELYFRVCAEVRDGNHLIASIKTLDEQKLYCWDSGIIESEGGNVDFDLSVYRLDQTQASVFNIADAAYWAWRYWNNNTANSPFMDRSVTIFWQAGQKRTGSFYNKDRAAVVVADDASSADEWDDSVIIHEWGHFADHQFSCYQNPGGAHTLPGVNAGANATRLAWGEGYPDYYQSVARTIMPGSASISFYVDPSGPTVDLENMRAVSDSDADEGAVAALLWDLHDTANEGGDKVNHGHGAIQRVYASVGFKGNTQCDLRAFLKEWRNLGLAADSVTASTLMHNVNITHISAPPFDVRWWEQATIVIDNSSSMAGQKINAVKAIVGEQVNDLAPLPQGTEFNLYTFNAGTPDFNVLLEGKFFADQIMPTVNNLVANGANSGCPVPGLSHLIRASRDKNGNHTWLYTDGDNLGNITPETVKHLLTERNNRGSIVLLGGCGSPASPSPEVTGTERTYLNLAATGARSTGIVPYMMSALLTGGQFIYVAPDQLANAVDMVRAQLSHTAGAGRWSDYVSTGFTYRWDRLESWEYQPPNWLSTDHGPLGSTPLRITLDEPFNFFGDTTSVVDVSEDGFIVVNPCLVDPQFCPALSTQFINILDTDLNWVYINPPPNRETTACGLPDTWGPQVRVYTAKYASQWTIISTVGLANYGGGDTACRAYQVWLNNVTGEIRFQYVNLRQEAATAEISLIDSLLFTGNNVPVSNNDLSGASSGMGYKFTPAPPQPTKTYQVEVDPLIESVIFMQTGYSGTFAPMTVTRPGGAAVNCADTANVKCITVHNKPGDNMVQFIQVDTNGIGGVFTAAVAVGSSGNGTFSFNALAAGELSPITISPHTLALKGSHSFTVELGRAVDGNTLTGWLQTPAGQPFGSSFTLYDDGAHGDGKAGDGRFGSGPFTPPTAGAAYLWIEGAAGGVNFKRSDPVPFNFQPLYIWSTLDKEGFYNDTVPLTFWIENLRSVQHCYAIEFTVPDGWTLFSPEAPSICIPPQTTTPVYAYVGKPLGSGALGEVGEISLTMTEMYEGVITASSSARVALFRPVAAIEFDNRQVGPIRPNGTDTVELTLNLYDDLGQNIGYSGPFNGEIIVTGGTYELPTGLYEDGRLRVIFTAGTSPGTATLSAMAEGGHMAETTIAMAEPIATDIQLTASPIDLSNASQSALTVTVRDLYGDPAPGETVRLSVSDDKGDQGEINGGEMFEGATNKDGQLKANFVKTAGGTGAVIIRAELLGTGGEVLREASVTLYLSGIQAPSRVFLPMVRR